MKVDQKIHDRLKELSENSPEKRTTHHQSHHYDYNQEEVSVKIAAQWGNSCLHILKLAFGQESDYYTNFNAHIKVHSYNLYLDPLVGIMKAAFDDYSLGFALDLKTAISGEIFQDFLELAKRALQEGNKDVAAVLASAALEDTLKRYAEKQGLNIDDKDLTEIVNTLKSQGLVGGTLKNSLAAMVKIRNCAMHADWSKISAPDVSSLTAFVEQFLITHF